MTENVDTESRLKLYGLCKSGSVDDLERFFAGYPDINTVEPWSHNSALVLASEYGRLEIVEYLIDKGADVNKLGHYGISALIKAAQNGNADIVRLLIENGAKLDIKERDQGLTALTSAIRTNGTEIAKILLHAGAKVNHPSGKLGNSSLAIAVVKDNIELADLLIKDGADVNLISAAKVPLMGARSYEMTQLLLNNGADPYFKDEYGGTIINGFMYLDTTGPLKALLDHGVSIEQTSGDGDTPLMRAARFGGASFVRLLLDQNADVNATNDKGETAFLKAADRGDVGVLGVLYDTGDVSIDYKDHYVGYSALYRASKEGHIEAVKYLLEKGANTESRNIGRYTALHAACNKGSKDVVESLLKAGADIFVRDRNYTTPLDAARKYGGNDELVALLEGCYADDGKDSRPQILRIIENKNIECAREAIDKCSDIHAVDVNGWSALIYAIWFDKVELVPSLINRDVDTDILDIFGITPLMMAAMKGDPDLMQLLMDNGVDIHSTDGNGNSALNWAVGSKSNKCLEVLAGSGCDVDNVGNFEVTPLIEAVFNRRSYDIEMVDTLLRYGASIDAVDRYGKTALMYSVFTGDVKLVELLLKYNSDIDMLSNNGLTALMYAVNGRDKKIIKLLLKSGANLDIKNADGLTALEMTKLKGIKQLFEAKHLLV